jgi:hypothetical protein
VASNLIQRTEAPLATSETRKDLGLQYFPEACASYHNVRVFWEGFPESFLSLLSAYAVVNKSSLGHSAGIVQISTVEDNGFY